MKYYLSLVLGLYLLAACGAEPKLGDWVRGPCPPDCYRAHLSGADLREA